jgi:hypothetical protein
MTKPYRNSFREGDVVRLPDGTVGLIEEIEERFNGRIYHVRLHTRKRCLEASEGDLEIIERGTDWRRAS